MMPLNTHVLNAAPRQWVNRVTPLTSALQQVVVSFAVAGMTGYMTSRINHHALEAGKGGNPLEVSVLGFDDVFLLSAWLAVAGVALCLILRKPKEMVVESEQGEEGKPDPSLMIGH
jgi:hypothetical protein